ncbi:hypothetical protein [Clostridium disporicum]|uniref:Uncharacterized protein n=1 Tax=Clostridium disporicum TaxID=84024 RepID=A0A174I7R7_9CLOT|nr:hypothetical protein [Clostridium disporicum]CUO82126.1 Uncharacterised protein [Clostridium disporicum]
MNEINVEDAVIKSVRMYNDDYELFKLLAKENGITQAEFMHNLIDGFQKNNLQYKNEKYQEEKCCEGRLLDEIILEKDEEIKIRDEKISLLYKECKRYFDNDIKYRLEKLELEFKLKKR